MRFAGALILIVGSCIAAGRVAACVEGEPPLPLEMWLREQSRAMGASGESSEGWFVRFTFERRSLLSKEEVEAQWKAVAPFPDHPKRAGIEMHRALQSSPDREEVTISYCDGGAWSLHRTLGGGGVLRAGGDGIARWSLYTSPAVKPGPGQLTIIGNGVAFPQVYNLSRFVDVSREHLGRLLHAGLPEYAGNVEIVVQRDSPTGWAVVVRRPGEALGGTVFSGDSRGADGARRVTRVEQIGIGTPGEKTDQWSFESFEPIAGTDITAPRRIEHRTTYSVLEVTSVLELSRVPRRQVEEGAVEPTAEPGITVRDFRDLASPAWAPYETSTRMTWSRSEGADRYDLPTAEDIENSKQRKGMVGLPPPAPSGGGLSRWVIGGTVLIGAIGVPMVLRVWPRKA